MADDQEKNFIDFYVNTALDLARQSVAGKIKDPYYYLPGDLFAELSPKNRELYMEGIRRLPNPMLSQFFNLPAESSQTWTKENLDRYLQNYMNIHSTGPQSGTDSEDYPGGSVGNAKR